jgi:CRISPR-associated protein Cas1
MPKLPWLTPESLLSAWEHVEENAGCAGADGITIDQFASSLDDRISALLREVETDEYRALPLLPIVVQKKPSSIETRTLMVPAVRDRVLQTVVGRQLGMAFEDEFLDCSFAYRPRRSVNSAIARIRFLHDHGYRYVAEADIEKFFDRIVHALLRQRLAATIADRSMLMLIDTWIDGPVWDGRNIRPLRQGVPQGSPISPLLANLFLSDFDLAIEQAGMKLIRYADDFLILAQDSEHAASAIAIARDKLEELHLQLKDEKTHIGSFEEGFRFLGALFLDANVWIPWDKQARIRRVLSIPQPMPPGLVRRWLEPPARTAMARAFSAAQVEHIDSAASSNTEDEEMAYLYLVEQGSILRKMGNRLVVEKDGSILLDTPYHKLEAVLIFGNVQVTTQAIGELLEYGVRLNLLSRHGELRGSLDPAQGKNIPLRIAQFELHRDAQRVLAMARVLVDAKITNCSQVLATFGSHEEERAPEAQEAIVQLSNSRQAAASAADLDALNGVEGAAARLYFDALMRRNKSAFHWPGRVKHPATDPINSLLSFTYTLVGNELAGLAEGLGLDSFLGSLHQLDYGRRSLALDLVEMFRGPLADRLVLTMCNRNQFSEADFEPAEGGALHLRPESAKRFFAEYERWMLHVSSGSGGTGFRTALRKTVEDYVAAVRDSHPFQPFLYDPEAAAPAAMEAVQP